MSIPSATRTRLEKAAADNGFDRELASAGGWVHFGSSHAPLEVWLGAVEGGRLLAALSRDDVALALAGLGVPCEPALPPGAQIALAVSDVPVLHQLLRRAYQLARTLPDEILHVFQANTAELPRSTEAERLVIQRVGQTLFRERLMEYWQGRCAITGLAVPELLRASHIKPWAACEMDAERLDVFNGLLLAPHLDAVFDAGLITVAENGSVIVSARLSASDRDLLGLSHGLRVQRLAPGHQRFLAWHRAREFRDSTREQ